MGQNNLRSGVLFFRRGKKMNARSQVIMGYGFKYDLCFSFRSGALISVTLRHIKHVQFTWAMSKPLLGPSLASIWLANAAGIPRHRHVPGVKLGDFSWHAYTKCENVGNSSFVLLLVFVCLPWFYKPLAVRLDNCISEEWINNVLFCSRSIKGFVLALAASLTDWAVCVQKRTSLPACPLRLFWIGVVLKLSTITKRSFVRHESFIYEDIPQFVEVSKLSLDLPEQFDANKVQHFPVWLSNTSLVLRETTDPGRSVL